MHLACPNRNCSNFDLQDVLVWMENISPYDGLGDILKLKFLSEVFGENYISIDAIYKTGPLDRKPTNLVKFNAFIDMYNKLFTNKVKLEDAIRALNIPRFGEVTSRKLAQYPDDVQMILYSLETCTEWEDDISEEIGDANYQSLRKHLWKFRRLLYIKENIDFTTKSQERGKVAITGKLSVKRAVFEEELRSLGYVPGNISKDTKYLITDDPTSDSEKNRKADKYGIVKITEKEFREKYM